MTRDVTGRELTEGVWVQKVFREALLEAHSHAGIGLLIVEDGHIRYANDAFYVISGYSAAELGTLPTFSEFTASDYMHSVRDRVLGRLKSGLVEDRCEVSILHRSGRRVEVELVLTPLCKENPYSRFIAIVRDITRRKRVEEKLESALGALDAIHEAGRTLNLTLQPREIGSILLGIMRRVCAFDAAIISLYNGDRRSEMLASVGLENTWKAGVDTAEAQSARLRTLESKEYQIIRLRKSEKVDTASVMLCLPLIQGWTIGMVEVFGPETLAEEQVARNLDSLARQATTALENAQQCQRVADHKRQLKDLGDELLAVRAEEGRRVACDVHYMLTQRAIATYQNLQACAEDLPHSARFSKKLDRVLALAKRTVEEARRVIASFQPPPLKDSTLAAALQAQVYALRAEDWEIVYEEDMWDRSLPPEVETVLYMVAQEALMNVRKHAGTTQVQVSLVQLGKEVCLRIRDCGRGFNGPVPPQGNREVGERTGLSTMRKRIALLGGELTVRSRPQAGTTVVAEIPLPSKIPDHGEQMLGAPSVAVPGRLLIATNHTLVREGFQALLAGEPDLEIVGTATHGQEAVERCRCLQPDLMLMDSQVPKMDALVATRAIKEENPDVAILILTTDANSGYLLEAVRAGANGYLTKDSTKCDLIVAMRGALTKKHAFDQELAKRPPQDFAGEDGYRTVTPQEYAKCGFAERTEPPLDRLTPRELEVLQLLAQGLTNRQISQNLVISAATVKVHVEHILKKLKVSDRTQAAVRASETRLVNFKK